METTANNTFEAEIMPIDLLCDTCQSEITVGETAYINKEQGSVHCEKCAESLGNE